MRIRFAVTRVVQDGTGTTFEAGQEYDLPEPSAHRWLRRGVATVVPVEAPPVVAAAEASLPPSEPDGTDQPDSDVDIVVDTPRRGQRKQNIKRKTNGA